MQPAPYTTNLTPFEQMLEDLQTAITAGDTPTEQRLRAAVEADLNARGAVFGISAR